MSLNPLGKTLDQVLTAYQASNVRREPRTGYESLKADLPNGGTLSAKVLPTGPGGGEVSWIIAKPDTRTSNFLTFSRDGWVDTFQTTEFDPNSSTFSPTKMTYEADYNGDGVPDVHREWKKK